MLDWPEIVARAHDIDTLPGWLTVLARWAGGCALVLLLAWGGPS